MKTSYKRKHDFHYLTLINDTDRLASQRRKGSVEKRWIQTLGKPVAITTQFALGLHRLRKAGAILQLISSTERTRDTAKNGLYFLHKRTHTEIPIGLKNGRR